MSKELGYLLMSIGCLTGGLLVAFYCADSGLRIWLLGASLVTVLIVMAREALE